MDKDKYSEAIKILDKDASILEGTYVNNRLKEEQKWRQLIKKQEGFQKEIVELIGPFLYFKGKFAQHFESYSLDETIALVKIRRRYKRILNRKPRKMDVKEDISGLPTSEFSLPPLEKPLLTVLKCEYCIGGLGTWQI